MIQIDPFYSICSLLLIQKGLIANMVSLFDNDILLVHETYSKLVFKSCILELYFVRTDMRYAVDL